MNAKTNIAAFALALAASPLAAQITVRNDGSVRTGTSGTVRTGTTARERIEAARDRAEAARARVDMGSTRASGSSRIPPGHLPPRGLCRVWIDGVPPGQQPPVTDCATAERNRVVNSRVVYGDRETFRGKGKYKKAQRNSDSARQCSIWDGVVVDGRVVNVCRDGSVHGDRSDRSNRDGVFRDRNDDDDSDDRWSRSEKSSKKFEKQAQKSSKRFEKQARKASKNGNWGGH